MQMHFLWKNVICIVLLSVRVIAQQPDPSCPCVAHRDCTSCVIGQNPQNFPLQTMFQPRNTVERAPEHERYSTVTFKRFPSPCSTTCSWNRMLETCSDTNYQLLPDRNLVPPLDLDSFSPGGRYDLYTRFQISTLCQDPEGKRFLALRPTFANK